MRGRSIGNPGRIALLISALCVAMVALSCGGTKTRPVTTQVVVLGFDGADPDLLAKWAKEGHLPNLQRLAESGTFRPLGTTNPPESPVAWASFATGLNPGGTGIFDFLKRDPQTCSGQAWVFPTFAGRGGRFSISART
ncbi:MAG: alkaline phosphatase family protein [Acidobacteriia bacterium]|nr:alkaline phosphatase family protein [Terriglobia bacterium]